MTKLRSRGKQILHSRVAWFLVIVFLVVVLTHYFVFEWIQVSGFSMEDTLGNGDIICIEKISYRKVAPKRNDIVVVDTKNGNQKQQYIKRIIGLPGEKVKIKKGHVYINGKQLKEIKSFDEIEDGGMARDTIFLGKDEYFLLGDNRNNSKDSRNVELGIVKKQQIRGKLCFRIMPIGQAGKVK